MGFVFCVEGEDGDIDGECDEEGWGFVGVYVELGWLESKEADYRDCENCYSWDYFKERLES